MDIEYIDFIGFYRNVYPQGYCNFLIEQFDILEKKSVGFNRQDTGEIKHHKDDYQIFANVININRFNLDSFSFTKNNESHNLKPADIFFNGLQTCYSDYVKKYSLVSEMRVKATSMKMQRTAPGGGYHIWHIEQGNSADSCTRVMVYMLYLNNLDKEGGETEFLYQKQRIKPEENLMLLWPAGYTHPHRGNPVLGIKNKYIVTGWFVLD